MPFTVPRTTATGRLLAPDQKAPLGTGQRCLVCFETDPTRYWNCTSSDCHPIGPFSEPPTFTQPKPLVSAFALAARMRRKALSLEWDQDSERDALLKRARELEKGDSAEVPDEDF